MSTSNLSSGTKCKYASIIKNYKNLDVENPDSIASNLMTLPISATYKKTIMCAFYNKYKTMHGEGAPCDGTYRRIISELSVETKKKEKSHTNKASKIDLESITHKLDRMSIKRADVDLLIKAMYCYMPPRRLLDYSSMRYVETSDGIKQDGLFNYYVKLDNIFYFQRYKTFKSFGVQKMILSPQITRIMKQYLSNHHLNNGDSLLQFGKKKIDVCPYSSLRDHVLKLFGGTVNAIRHAYITQLYMKTPKALLNVNETSAAMGHNISTHLAYLDKGHPDMESSDSDSQ